MTDLRGERSNRSGSLGAGRRDGPGPFGITTFRAAASGTMPQEWTGPVRNNELPRGPVMGVYVWE